jgi:hypothetical protein
MTDFFSQPQVQYRPGLEPPGFDILRELLIRQIINQKQNPYGMSQQGAGNITGPLFSPQAHNAPALGYMGMGGGYGGPTQGSAPPPMPPQGAPMGVGSPPIGGGTQGGQPPPGWFFSLLKQLQQQSQPQAAPQQPVPQATHYDSVTPQYPTEFANNPAGAPFMHNTQTPAPGRFPTWGRQNPTLAGRGIPAPMPPTEAPNQVSGGPSMGNWWAQHAGGQHPAAGGFNPIMQNFANLYRGSQNWTGWRPNPVMSTGPL